jgi:hypothetical protein
MDHSLRTEGSSFFFHDLGRSKIKITRTGWVCRLGISVRNGCTDIVTASRPAMFMLSVH